MILITGLGNPGKEYEKTRHSVGFLAIDAIATNFQFPIFKFQSIFNAQISKKTADNQEIILAKPQTFMNESGTAVEKLIKNYKLKIKNLIVIHDDIDLPLGEFKISKNRGSAGHKGVQSIINELKTKDFSRVRIGICPKIGKPKAVEKFVLQNFTKTEEKALQAVIPKIIDLLKSDVNKLTSIS